MRKPKRCASGKAASYSKATCQLRAIRARVKLAGCTFGNICLRLPYSGGIGKTNLCRHHFLTRDQIYVLSKWDIDQWSAKIRDKETKRNWYVTSKTVFGSIPAFPTARSSSINQMRLVRKKVHDAQLTNSNWKSRPLLPLVAFP